MKQEKIFFKIKNVLKECNLHVYKNVYCED